MVSNFTIKKRPKPLGRTTLALASEQTLRVIRKSGIETNNVKQCLCEPSPITNWRGEAISRNREDKIAQNAYCYTMGDCFGFEKPRKDEMSTNPVLRMTRHYWIGKPSPWYSSFISANLTHKVEPSGVNRASEISLSNASRFC